MFKRLHTLFMRSEKSDTGCYLCEVNTEPKSTVYAVYLNVIDAYVPKAPPVPTKRTTRLMANMIGDEVLLNCTITVTNESNSLDDEVQWSRDGRPIDFSNSNKYISKVKRDSRTIIHTLRILGASSEDDGNYACRAVDAPESSHMLHVNSNGAMRCTSLLRISCLLISLSFLLHICDTV
uniref:Ig-like domain-containing protein n=1 Tax=Parascaris univalens TaxID=6257 RepID=A0A915BYW5_PARUN